jgi:DNA-binding response OmpR family regulator
LFINLTNNRIEQDRTIYFNTHKAQGAPQVKDVLVTAGEFDLLKIFAEHPNRPLSRDWMLEITSHRSAILSTAPSEVRNTD